MFLIRVFLVGLLIIPVIFAKPGGSGNKETLFDKEFRKKQQNCERNFCNYLPNSFNENCINQCISKLCYEKSFFNYGLEPGEIDLKRFFHNFYKIFKFGFY